VAKYSLLAAKTAHDLKNTGKKRMRPCTIYRPTGHCDQLDLRTKAMALAREFRREDTGMNTIGTLLRGRGPDGNAADGGAPRRYGRSGGGCACLIACPRWVPAAGPVSGLGLLLPAQVAQ